MAQVKTRLRRIDAWLGGARKAMAAPAELKDLLDLHREAEALRIKVRLQHLQHLQPN